MYDVGTTGDWGYVVLEFLDGGTLNEQWATAPPTPREAAALMKVVAVAISELHSRHALHHDLKLDHILLDSEGIPRIAMPQPASWPTTWIGS